MDIRVKRLISLHLAAIVGIVVFLFVTNVLFSDGCLIKIVTGYCCPTCGMTRALFCIVKGDFYGYVQYNAMSIPCASAVIVGFHTNKIKHKAISNGFICAVAICTFAYYIERIISGTLPF